MPAPREPPDFCAPLPWKGAPNYKVGDFCAALPWVCSHSTLQARRCDRNSPGRGAPRFQRPLPARLKVVHNSMTLQFWASFDGRGAQKSTTLQFCAHEGMRQFGLVRIAMSCITRLPCSFGHAYMAEPCKGHAPTHAPTHPRTHAPAPPHLSLRAARPSVHPAMTQLVCETALSR